MSGNFTKQIIPVFLFQSPVNLPNWLLRIPETKLSYAAKILYGFMINMSDTKGIFSTNKLNFEEEIGMSDENFIKRLGELIDAKLIICRSNCTMFTGNEYEFYSHEWMEGQYNE